MVDNIYPLLSVPPTCATVGNITSKSSVSFVSILTILTIFPLIVIILAHTFYFVKSFPTKKYKKSEKK